MKKDIIIDNKLLYKVLIITGISGLIIGLSIVSLIAVNNFYKDNYLEFRSPFQSPILVKKRELPEVKEEPREMEVVKEEAVVEQEIKIAKVTGYSCGGITTEAERRMNCPNGKTASGTTPSPDRTMACDRANMGKKFYLDGIGERTCEDTGSSIVGAGVFDLYVEDIQTAREFGVQYISYKLVEDN